MPLCQSWFCCKAEGVGSGVEYFLGPRLKKALVRHFVFMGTPVRRGDLLVLGMLSRLHAVFLSFIFFPVPGATALL